MLFKAPVGGGKIKKRTTNGMSSVRNFSARGGKESWLRGNKKLINRIGFGILLLAFAWLAVYLLLFSSFLKISKIEISGENAIDANLVKQDVVGEFAGKYLNWIDKNNTLFINDIDLQNKLLGKYEKIKSVKVERVFPDGLKVLLEERMPAIVLCSNGECFAVDNDGFTYMQFNPEANDSQLNGLMRLTDDGNKAIKFKDFFLIGEYAQYVSSIQKSLKDELDIEVALDCHTPQLISGDIRVITQEGWWIYFDNSKSLQREIEILRAVLKEKIEKEGQRNNLEYIDLRTTNKAYYKLRNQEAVATDIVTSEIVAPKSEDKKKSDKKKK